MRRVEAGFCLLFVFLSGCWRGVDAADPAEVAFAGDATDLRSYRGSEVTAAPNAALVGGLLVPPDRATASASVEVRASDPAAAVERAQEVASYVHELWSEDPLCSVNMLDYRPAHVQGSEAAASFSVSVSVELSGLEATTDRMDRVEDCLARFRRIATDSGLRGVQVQVGAMMVTLDNPESFRAQLLQARLEPLREVSALENIPEQFHPAGVRCTSAGEVSILQRSLSGITLGVDFTCTQA